MGLETKGKRVQNLQMHGGTGIQESQEKLPLTPILPAVSEVKGIQTGRFLYSTGRLCARDLDGGMAF